MAKINGTNLRVYKDGNLLAYESEFTFSIETDLPDSSNKDSGGFAEHIIGQRSATLDVSAMVDFTADYGITEALSEVISRGDIAISWEDTTGTSFYAGIASYSSLSIGASNEDIVAWEGSITLNGTWTRYSDTISSGTINNVSVNGFAVQNAFGVDSFNYVYYLNSTTRVLKNGVQLTVSSLSDLADFGGYQSGKSAFVGGMADRITSYKDSSGKIMFTFPVLSNTLDCYFVDGNYIYFAENQEGIYYYRLDGTLIRSQNQSGEGRFLGVIKQNDHIVLLKETSLGALRIHVYSDGLVALIRTIELYTTVDGNAYMAVDEDFNLYISHVFGSNSRILKLPYNSPTIGAIATAGSALQYGQIQTFKNELYWLVGNDIRKYVADTLVDTYTDVTTNNAIDFVIDNNKVAFVADNTASQIKCIRL